LVIQADTRVASSATAFLGQVDHVVLSEVENAEEERVDARDVAILF